MFWLFFVVLVSCRVNGGEEDDLLLGLHIGNSIDVFANYGDLSQVTQVISTDYEENYVQVPTEPFREKNIEVFNHVTSIEYSGATMVDMNILLCETFDELLTKYFNNFYIEGTDKPWKAFIGDWVMDEILRTFGLEYDATKPDNCCYVLVILSRKHKTVELGDITDAIVKDYIQDAIEDLDVTKPNKVREFMRSFGTHYIKSYVTGNFMYQVFKYKRSGFSLLRSYIKARNNRPPSSTDLRFYFSSYFLKQVGEIRIASGNKTTEAWARENLRDSQYLFYRPSLLRLHYSPDLAYTLNDLFDNGALLGLELKTLKPLFKDSRKAEKYIEIVENDLKLWEING